VTAPTRMAGAAERLVRFPPLLFAQSLPRKRFFGPALFTGLHIEAMLLDFLDDVFLLHLALETAQSVLQRFTFLDDDFSHVDFTPNPVRIGFLRWCQAAELLTPPLEIIACKALRVHLDRMMASSNQFGPQKSSNLSGRSGGGVGRPKRGARSVFGLR